MKSIVMDGMSPEKIVMLMQAVDDTEEPTPGYIYEELRSISFCSRSSAEFLVKFFSKQLGSSSVNVRLKVLKLISYLVSHGSCHFRMAMRNNEERIRLAAEMRGPTDPLIGNSLYEDIKSISKDLLHILFDPDKIQRDSLDAKENTPKLTKYNCGIGSSGKGKLEGFGNSVNIGEDSLAHTILDIIGRVIHPEDKTSQLIRDALSSPIGNYKPVKIQHTYDIESKPSSTCDSAPIKAHVPGKAGGGWEDDADDDDNNENSHLSGVSSDSLEEIHCVTCEDFQTSEEMKIVKDFCCKEEWPVSINGLNEACSIFSTLNSVETLKCVCEFLAYSSENVIPAPVITIFKLRSLLVIEWFLRKDLIQSSVLSTICYAPVNKISKTEDDSSPLKYKALKIKLILDSLCSNAT